MAGVEQALGGVTGRGWARPPCGLEWGWGYTEICGVDRFLAIMWGNGLNVSPEWTGEVDGGECMHPGRRDWWLGPGW